MIALIGLTAALLSAVPAEARTPLVQTGSKAEAFPPVRGPQDGSDVATLRAVIAQTEAPWRRLSARAVALALSPPGEAQARDLAIVRATLAAWAPDVARRLAALRQRLALAEQAAADRRLRPLLTEAGLSSYATTVLLAACDGAALRPPADGPALTRRAAAALGRTAGLVLAAEPGAPVVAPAAGRVAYAAPFRRYGRIVVIEHGHGWASLLTGFGALIVRNGATVRAGERLGAASRTDGLVGLELTHRGRAVDAAAMMARCSS